MIYKKPKVLCPYCNKEAKLVTGEKIYPHLDYLFEKKFYLCEPCNAYVGCHPNTVKPLGSPANKELRKLRNKCHYLFDPIWKSKRLKRYYAYRWLASELNIDIEDCHIGMFDENMCLKVIDICEKTLFSE